MLKIESKLNQSLVSNWRWRKTRTNRRRSVLFGIKTNSLL